MRAIDKLLEDLKKKSDEFDNKIRYVIHGKSNTKYHDLAYGSTGMVKEDSDLVFLYNDKWFAQEAFDKYALWFERDGEKAEDCFEIREVGRDELYTIYLKANII